MTGFSLSHVEKGYGPLRVLADVTCSFAPGRVHVVTGASGAGKTTLLRLLMGLEEPDAGTVGRPGGARLAATFQEDRLLENLTATANIRLPHEPVRGAARAGLLERERAAMAAVGLPCDARPVRELSGGQRRRVAILRCALADADALFFDEPLKGMDDGTVARVMAFLVPRLAGRTTFWVTHDDRELSFFPDPLRWRIEDGTVRAW